jgi:uncharacterized protein DUF4157
MSERAPAPRQAPSAVSARVPDHALQRRVLSDARLDGVPQIVHDALASPGDPLDSQTQGFMETHFGHDFSQVRIHTDALAAHSAAAVNAHAYTVGGDIVFGAQQYAPGTATGKRLLAHELTHVAQQAQATAEPRVSAPADAHEREARVVAAQVVAGQPGAVSAPFASAAGGGPALVQRDGPGDNDDDLRRFRMPQFTSLATTLPTPTIPEQFPHLRFPELAIRPNPNLSLMPPGLGLPFRPPSVGSLSGLPASYLALPPLLPVHFTHNQLIALGSSALPDNLRLSIQGAGQDATATTTEPPQSATPPFVARGDTSIDVGADLSLGAQTAFETYISLVLQTDLAHIRLGHIPIDVLHQPTAQILVGVNLGDRPAGAPAVYHAAQISATLLNAHFNAFGHEIELGLGQVALGEQGGAMQVTAGGSLETHINSVVSLMLNGGVTFTPSPTGWDVTPGAFTFGFVVHGPVPPASPPPRVSPVSAAF